jgi:hypothetical protein
VDPHDLSQFSVQRNQRLYKGYLTELIHQRPHTWKGDVERLFAVLEELGDDRCRAVLQRALFQRLIGAEYVVRLAARGEEVAS